MVLQILLDEGRKLPACIKVSFLQSNCFGWLTDRRFRNIPYRPCVFNCQQEDGIDDFCHYSRCRILWNLFHRLGLGPFPDELLMTRSMLCLEGHSSIPLRMAFLHAAMVSVHKLRGPFCNLHADLRANLVRATFKDRICRSIELRRAFNAIWQERGPGPLG